MLRLYDLRWMLSSLEASAFPVQSGDSLSLIMSNNEIQAIGSLQDGIVSATAVYIATNPESGDQSSFTSTMICSGNKASNNSVTFPTVKIDAHNESRLTATGNLIFNENTAQSANSLVVTGDGARVVTGNIFLTPSKLPARTFTQSVPAPMNTWDFLNTTL